MHLLFFLYFHYVVRVPALIPDFNSIQLDTAGNELTEEHLQHADFQTADILTK